MIKPQNLMRQKTMGITKKLNVILPQILIFKLWSVCERSGTQKAGQAYPGLVLELASGLAGLGLGFHDQFLK